MRDDLVDLVRDAAAEPLETPDFDAMAARGRRQNEVARAGTALVAAVALVVGGLVLWPEAQPTRAPLIGDQRTTPSEPARPQGGAPFDPAARMRPELIEVTPDPAVPGETVELTFPEETPRGVAFVLEERSDAGWAWRYMLVSSPAGSQREPAWWPVDDHSDGDVQALGVHGPGPDRVVVPETAAPGEYRICTANAGDEFCAPLRIDGGQEPAMPSVTLPEAGAFVSESVEIAGARPGLFEDSEVSVEVSEEDEGRWLRWRAQCNYGSAMAELRDGRLVLFDGPLITHIRCLEPGADEQDDRLLAFFTSEPHWDQDGDRLRVWSADGASELVLTRRDVDGQPLHPHP